MVTYVSASPVLGEETGESPRLVSLTLDSLVTDCLKGIGKRNMTGYQNTTEIHKIQVKIKINSQGAGEIA